MNIYWDYNATTPVDERVLAAMLPFFTTHFGNPSSNTHIKGWDAAEAIKNARSLLADCIGASPSEVIFTSGATEAINLGLKGAAEIFAPQRNHIITVQTEHKAVLDTCLYLESRGIEVTYLSVDSEGLIDIEALKNAFRPETFLVCVMLANNEIGVIQPIKEIADITHHYGAWMMSDCVQAFGKVPVKVDTLGVDIMPLSAHKIYGPKGVGALYLRRRNPRIRLIPQIHGGGHENGLRSGSLNVPGIMGMAKAAEICVESFYTEAIKLKQLRDLLESFILEGTQGKVNGSTTNRLPNVSNLCFPGIKSEYLLMRTPHLCLSSGSACTSALNTPSHVLTAIGLNDSEAYASFRISLGRFTTENEIIEGGSRIRKAILSENPAFNDSKA